MIRFARRLADRMRALLSLPQRSREFNDDFKLLVGTLLSELVVKKTDYASLADLEFKIYSQFGDDGIVQYLTRNLGLRHRTFVEFGVEDYMQSTTRFLLQKDNWSGFVMDGSSACVEGIKTAPFFWKHDLRAETVFVTRENIRQLLRDNTREWGAIDLLQIDVDGNDYWIWSEIEQRPAIVIVEYNSLFGRERAITVPYAADFERARAHFSHLYWGASVRALHRLGTALGYAFVGCNGAGNNAYFVHRDFMNAAVREVPVEQGYVLSKYRESRDPAGKRSFLSGAARVEVIRGLPVFDVERNEVVPL